MDLIREVVSIYDNYGYDTEVLVASIRHPLHVTEAALAGGATSIAVALVEEGVRLRDAGIEAPILVLSQPPLEDAETMATRRLTPTAYRAEFAAAVAAVTAEPVPIHIKVDTGMHRVGALPEDVPGRVGAVLDDPTLEFAGLWTHFAVAEEDRLLAGCALG